MTPRQLEILQHALGLDKYGVVKYFHDGVCRYGFMPNRNYFCAGAQDEPDCRELVRLGFMREHVTTEVFPYYNCSVTDAGKKAVREQSPAPPKLTRSQQRWRRFVDSGAADCGVTFREFLARAEEGGAR